jgi:hypothetical protein
MINHWCFNNSEFSSFVVNCACVGIGENDYDELRSFFRLLNGVLSLKDNIQDSRIDSVLSSLLTTMDEQKDFWKATDYCIDHLIRIAKSSDQAFTWLGENASSVEWILVWLQENSEPPSSYGNRSRVKLTKPSKSRQGGYGYGGYNRSNYGGYNRVGAGYNAGGYNRNSQKNSHYGITNYEKQQAIQAILNQDVEALKAIEMEDSEMDLSLRVFEVEQKWDCQDKFGKWCQIEITELSKHQVKVHYVGWSSKWDEWVVRGSPRIQKLGKMTNREDVSKHKSRQA